jgi:hypothetical protein
MDRTTLHLIYSGIFLSIAALAAIRRTDPIIMWGNLILGTIWMATR